MNAGKIRFAVPQTLEVLPWVRTKAAAPELQSCALSLRQGQMQVRLLPGNLRYVERLIQEQREFAAEILRDALIMP